MGKSPVIKIKRKLSADQSKSRKEEVSSSSGCALADQTAKKKGSKNPPKRQRPKPTSVSRGQTARDMTAAGNIATTVTRTPQHQTPLIDKSKSRKPVAHGAKENVHKVKQNVKQKPPKRQTPKSKGGTTVPRTPKQETAFVRALGLTEEPKYSVAGEMYRMDFPEFRQHVTNKLPLYDGRAVATLGSYRKSRNFKLVCALHPDCPFLLHSKQQVYADELVCQEIKEVVNHTCSVQSHVETSLCSASFLEYVLREEQHELQGAQACVQIAKKFGIDLTSMPRRQMFYKAVKEARDKQNGDSALSAFRSPSPICVSQIPVFNLEPKAPIISDEPSSLGCQSDSTTVEFVTTSVESAPFIGPLARTTSVVEGPHPKQSKRTSIPSKKVKRKSDQSMRREANHLSSLECQSDSTTEILAVASAEGASFIGPLARTTGDAENSHPKQSKHRSISSKKVKRKSDQSMRREANHPSSLECQSDSTTENLAVTPAEGAPFIGPLARTTGDAENSHPKQSKRRSIPSKQSKRKSDQSMRGEAKRRSQHESVAENNVASKKRKVLDGRPTCATKSLPNIGPAPQPTSTSNSSQRSARQPKLEYMRLLESYTPRVDELSSRTSRPPCSTGSSTSTMNQHSGTKTKSDRVQNSNILYEGTPSPLPSRTLKPDCEESGDNSLLSPALTFPPRRTRASSSKLQNSSEKKQPEHIQNQQSKSDLNQHPNRKLKPPPAILTDCMTPGINDLPPRRSDVSSTATFADTAAANSQPESKQEQQLSSNAKRRPSRKWKSEHERLSDGMAPAEDDLPSRRSGAVSPATSTNTIGSKRQFKNKQDQQPSSNAKRQSTRKWKSEHKILLDGVAPAVDDPPTRRSGVTSTHTVATKRQPDSEQDKRSSSEAKQKRLLDGTTPAVDDPPPRRSCVVSPATCTKVATNRQPESKRDQQSSSEAKRKPSRKVILAHERLLDGMTPAANDLPTLRSGVSYTATCPDTDTVAANRRPEKMQPNRKLKPGREEPVENATPVVENLPSRRTRASNLGASVTLSGPCSKLEPRREKSVENATPVDEELPSRRTRSSNTGAGVLLSEAGSKLKPGPGSKQKPRREESAENATPVVEELPSRRTRASNLGAGVLLSEVGSKLKPEHQKSVKNATPVVEELPSWRTHSSNTGAGVLLSEVGSKQKPEHRKSVENATAVADELPSRRTRASHTGAASVTLPEPGSKLKPRREKPVENVTQVVEELPFRWTRSSNTGAASVTLPEPDSKLKPRREKPVENVTPVVEELLFRRTRSSNTGATSVALSGPDSKLKPICEKSVENATPVVGDSQFRRTRSPNTGATSVALSGPDSKLKPRREKAVENVTPVVEELPFRRTRSSNTGATSVALSEPRSTPDQQCGNHSYKLEHERLLGNATVLVDELLPRRSIGAWSITPNRFSSSNLKQHRQPSRESGDNVGTHLPARKLEHKRLLDNMAPVHDDLPPRKTRSSLTSSLTPVLGNLPSRKTRASSTEFFSTTLHLPSMLDRQGKHENLEAKQLPARNSEDKKLSEGLASLGDLKSGVSRGRSGAGQSRNHKRETEHGRQGPVWINPGELREADAFVAETSAQITGPVVLFHVALVEEYRRLAARDVYEFVNFGLSLASTKAAIDLKLKELNLYMDKDHGDKDIEAERVDHSRSLKDFSRLADAERLEKLRESEEDTRQRLVADYRNRAKRVNPMRAEVSALISRPIRFEEGMEVGRRNKEPCCIGPDCTFCQKANAQDVQPREEPLPRFRRFDMTQLDDNDESNDSACAIGDRARRNRPARVGKREASRLALSEMQHSLSFIEALNATERTIEHRLF